MAVKIRLTRRGRKKRAMYDVIVADARSPRDGRLIEKLGTYNPLTNPASILIDEEKALDWLLKGAQPTDTARRILSYKGIMLKKHLQVGVLKGAITQEQADKKLEEWLKGKESEISSKLDSLNQKKAAEAKAKHEAEVKVKEAKAEALKQKLAALEPAVEEVEEEATEEASNAEDAPSEEAVTAETATEEAPAKEKEEEPKA
jgi:small subunit ribosomal protein S16